MISKIKNKDGRIVKIQENGETIWTEENTVRRSKISKESREEQKQAIKDADIVKRVENLEKIIFGNEIHK